MRGHIPWGVERGKNRGAGRWRRSRLDPRGLDRRARQGEPGVQVLQGCTHPRAARPLTTPRPGRRLEIHLFSGQQLHLPDGAALAQLRPATQANQSSLVGQGQTRAADGSRPSPDSQGYGGAALSEAEPVGPEDGAELAPWSHPLCPASTGAEINNLGSFCPGALLSASASLSVSLSFQIPLSVSRWLFLFPSPLPPQSDILRVSGGVGPHAAGQAGISWGLRGWQAALGSLL